jgi:hypothetical protein
LILDKGAKNVWEKRRPLQQWVLGKLDSHMQRTEIPVSPPAQKQFKMEQRPQSLKLFEKNIGETLEVIGNYFMLTKDSKNQQMGLH